MKAAKTLVNTSKDTGKLLDGWQLVRINSSHDACFAFCTARVCQRVTSKSSRNATQKLHTKSLNWQRISRTKATAKRYWCVGERNHVEQELAPVDQQRPQDRIKLRTRTSRSEKTRRPHGLRTGNNSQQAYTRARTHRVHAIKPAFCQDRSRETPPERDRAP